MCTCRLDCFRLRFDLFENWSYTTKRETFNREDLDNSIALIDEPGFDAIGCSASVSVIVLSAASLFSTVSAGKVDEPAAHGSKSSSVPQSTSVSIL